ncbi:MAG: copper resistance CopC family protein [Dermatophilaceae bacterium]
MASSAVGLALVTSVVNAASASAHAELVKVTPDVDAQLTTAPKEVVLEFSEPVNASFATSVVTTSAGVSVTNGKPTVIGAKVTQALVPHLAAGTYLVAFRVVSNDGHPVTGESGFTLTLAPRTSPSVSARSTSPSATPRLLQRTWHQPSAPMPARMAG